jgi:hypothetical protein
MGCFSGDEEPLYVILPYFNFCGFKSRRRLFIDFVERNKDLKGVRFVVSEVLGSAPLPKLSVWKHIKTSTKCQVWLKESIINMASTHLPKDWKYLAWIDADILFLNQNWVQDTKEILEYYDIAQLFQTAVNMGPRGEAMKTDKSFGYMHSRSGTPYTASDKYGFWHPGYAWACTRSAWGKMGCLLDWAILGSADRHMALAWIGQVETSCPGNVHTNYTKMLLEFQKKCKGLRIGNIDGTILHEWHGRLEDRKYKERWDILTRHQFDPLSDLGLSKDGIIQLVKNGVRMQVELDSYFLGRKEDS